MVPLFVGSTGDHAGQSLVAWAVARRILERGFRVGFLKPLSGRNVQGETVEPDGDVLLFQEVLALDAPLERMCPELFTDVHAGPRGPDEILTRLNGLVHELSLDKDVLLMMGSKEIFLDDASRPVSDISIIQGADAACLLVSRYRDTATSLYSILSVCSLLKDRVKGIILNRVPPDRIEPLTTQLLPFLVQKGIPRTALLPEDPVLSSRSLREIVEITGGEVLSGIDRVDNPVGGMTVGSLDLEGSLGLFRRVYNKIVLLEPCSMEPGTDGEPARRSVAGIILTGGRRPAPVVLEAAAKASVPMVLVQGDTFATLDSLERTATPLSPRDEIKVRRITELMDRVGALDRLLLDIGIGLG